MKSRNQWALRFSPTENLTRILLYLTVSFFVRDLDTLIKAFPPTNGNPKDNDQNEVQDPPTIASGRSGSEIRRLTGFHR